MAVRTSLAVNKWSIWHLASRDVSRKSFPFTVWMGGRFIRLHSLLLTAGYFYAGTGLSFHILRTMEFLPRMQKEKKEETIPRLNIAVQKEYRWPTFALVWISYTFNLFDKDLHYLPIRRISQFIVSKCVALGTSQPFAKNRSQISDILSDQLNPSRVQHSQTQNHT